MKKHYKPDGKEYTGATHIHNGRLMSGKTHTSKSVYLTNSPPAKNKTKY